MVNLLLILLGPPAMCFATWCAYGMPVPNRSLRKHQRCLESIARLELELLPDLPRELAWVENTWGLRDCAKPEHQKIGPGAVWTVNAANYVQVNRHTMGVQAALKDIPSPMVIQTESGNFIDKAYGETHAEGDLF